jgi:hypothetical protein
MAILNKLVNQISLAGYSDDMPEYEKKRMIIFNRLNFCAFCISIVRFIYILFFTPGYYSCNVLAINILPAGFFAAMAILVYYKQFKLATISEFLVIPPLLSMVNRVTLDSGLDMFVVLYMLFCFFYLNRVKNVLFAFLYCFTFFMD